MASSSRTQGPIKRLLTELQTYQSDPNEALLELGPVNDDELMSWRAVMKGVPGTAYEGTQVPSRPQLEAVHLLAHPSCPIHASTLTHRRRWALAPPHLHPLHLPFDPSDHKILNSNLPPQRRLPHRRDLPRPP